MLGMTCLILFRSQPCAVRERLRTNNKLNESSGLKLFPRSVVLLKEESRSFALLR